MNEIGAAINEPSERERQIPAHFILLDQQISEVERLLATLNERLLPVCQDVVSKIPASDEPFPDLCPIANLIMQQRMRLKTVASRISNILASLEV